MSERKRVLVTGAGGFIGHHLVTYLKKRGDWVRGVDFKAPEFCRSDADEFVVAPEDPTALAQAVGALFRNKALRTSMGARGRAYAHEHWNRERILPRMEAELLDLGAVNASQRPGAYVSPRSVGRF